MARADDATAADRPSWSLKPAGSVCNYLLYNSRPFYAAPQRVWGETVVTGGAIFTYKDIVRAEGVLMGVKTIGNDPYNRAFVAVNPLRAIPFTVTLGRQPIQIGTQFLVGDGILEGVGGATQGVYFGPRIGFDAVKVEWAPPLGCVSRARGTPQGVKGRRAEGTKDVYH